jgi:hypothetical protein
LSAALPCGVSDVTTWLNLMTIGLSAAWAEPISASAAIDAAVKIPEKIQ